MGIDACRADKLGYGDLPIAAVMSLPAGILTGLVLKAPTFPVARADALRNIHDHLAAGDLRGSALYMSKAIVRPEALVLQLGELPAGPHARGSWVAFVDLVPDQSWAHGCRYVFVDDDGSVREVAANWYPLRLRELFAPIPT